MKKVYIDYEITNANTMKNIEFGECFIYQEELYMRVEAIYDFRGNPLNAVSIETARLRYIASDIRVVPCKVNITASYPETKGEN